MKMSQKKRPRSPPPTAEVYTSEPIHDRQSRFVAYFTPNTSNPKAFQNAHAAFQSASHKILAWRKPSAQRSLSASAPVIYESSHDDDGEQYGGRHVERILKDLDVIGVCVVARWYGGVMLGPVRFKHMEDAASEAVERWKYAEGQREGKKRRLEMEEREREELIRGLGERDVSVEVLRKLAGEKEGRVKAVLVKGMEELDGEDAGAEDKHAAAATPASPAKPAMDYSEMPIERLRALDKARDATLSFLLKRISKAEADLAALGETEERRLDKDDAADKPP